ncbi:MAG: glycosyltransferase, partial [Acidimicrobiales bacterium]
LGAPPTATPTVRHSIEIELTPPRIAVSVVEPTTPGSEGDHRGLAAAGSWPQRRVAFVSWIDFHGRSHNLARALGAEAHFVAVGRPRLATAPLRHVVQGARTAVLLARRRPQTLFVMAPPLPVVLLGLLYAHTCRARLVIDAHTAAVLDRRTGTHMKPWFPRVARHAQLTIVTTEWLAEMLRSRGVRAVALNDAPIDANRSEEPAAHDRSVAVMPASWDRDEPISQVVEMARRLPEVDVVITGHPRRGRTGRHPLPSNLRLAGQLRPDAYASLLRSSDVVLALTTAESTMQQAAYEAVAYGRPLVLSGTQALRDYFTSSAVFVDPRDPSSIADGVASALERGSELSSQSATLRDERAAQWRSELAGVIERLDDAGPLQDTAPA